MFIVQDHPWTGSDAQLQSLQDIKVQTYVSYALDGQMVAAYPDTVGLKWRIVIHAQTGLCLTSAQNSFGRPNQRLTGYGGASKPESAPPDSSSPHCLYLRRAAISASIGNEHDSGNRGRSRGLAKDRPILRRDGPFESEHTLGRLSRVSWNLRWRSPA